MRYIFLFFVAIVYFAQPVQTHALSCMQQDFSAQVQSAQSVLTIVPQKQIATKIGKSFNSFTWTIAVTNIYKQGTSSVPTIEDLVWPGGEDTMSRLQAGKEYLVFINENATLDLCAYPRLLETSPLSAAEQQILNGNVASCAPYICADNSQFAACSDDGQPIMYFVEPCQLHGGHASSMASSVPTASDFTDVSSNYVYYDAIKWAKDNAIIKGYDDGTFKPDNTINRAEFLKILLTPVTAVCRAYFNYSDVDFSAWYGDYIQAASCQGLVTGYEDTSFKPATTINMAEAAKIIVKKDSNNTVMQDDTGIWYEPFMAYLRQHGALSATISSASQYITRGEMVEIMYKLSISTYVSPSSSSSSVQGTDVLLEAKNTGGLCIYGGCMTSYIFKKDGSVVINSNNSQRTVQLPAVQLSALNLFLQNTDVIDIMKHPFTGTCPRAYDGSAYIYTLYQNGIITTIDSCDYVTDASIFTLVQELINTIQL